MNDDPELERVEQWLAKTGVAPSALGRHLASDQALISRWRKCSTKVTLAKRALILEFIEKNPTGIPGYKGQARKRRQHGATFSPGSTFAGRQKVEPSTEVPVPALSEVEDAEWVKQRAIAQGVPLVKVLADMVKLGILCQKELEREEDN